MISTRTVWAVWVGLVALPLFLVSLLAPEYKEVCEISKETAQNNCTTHFYATYLLLEFLKVIDPYSVFATAVATSFIAWFTIKLSAVGRQQAAISTRQVDHLQAIERAWVFGKPKFSDAPGNSSVHFLVIKNHGKTPGFVKVVHVQQMQSEPGNPIPRYEGTPEQVQIVLSAGETHKDDRLFRGANPTYLVGYIRYVDIFDDIYVSRFCFRVAKTGTAEMIEMAGHPAWNAHYKEKQN